MTTLSYHAMRMAWCRVALWAFVRRWAAYLMAGASVLVLGMAGGMADAVTTVRAMCAWLVLPLFRAAGEPLWVVPAVALQALVGAGLVWGMRPLLWPVRWRMSERALPLARRELLNSDLRVVPLGLLPFALPCAIGAQALVAAHPVWLHSVRAVLALVVALVCSVGLGVALLQWSRRPSRSLRGEGSRVASVGASIPAPVSPMTLSATLRTSHGTTSSHPAGVASIAWPTALLWWPLWRGPARRSGHALLIGSTALCLPPIGMLAWPAAASWWLAAHAGAALLVVTRVGSLARQELAPLLLACGPLPLAGRNVARARDGIAMAPLVLSLPLLLVALPWAGVRPAVLAGYLLAVATSCALEAGSRVAQPSDNSVRWLFCLIVMLAFASEVMR